MLLPHFSTATHELVRATAAASDRRSTHGKAGEQEQCSGAQRIVVTCPSLDLTEP